MKKKLFSSILFLVLFFALSTACFAFDDVPLDHPWADGIFYLEQTGIVKGNGEGQFLPAEHITTEQWAIMLCRALNIPFEEGFDDPLRLGYDEGWFSFEWFDQELSHICRGAFLESAFKAFHIQIYPYDLYPGGTMLSSWENHLRVAKELGITPLGTGAYEQMTRDEAAQTLYLLMTQEYEVCPPEIMEYLNIENVDNVKVSPYLRWLDMIPDVILKEFHDREWKIILDDERTDAVKLSQGRCIGLTVYGEKTIYLAEDKATVHEMGHFYEKVLGFPKVIRELYEKEARAASIILGEYSTTDRAEYFAEFFEYLIYFGNVSRRMEKLKQTTPETYAYFQTLQANGWGKPAK